MPRDRIRIADASIEFNELSTAVQKPGSVAGRSLHLRYFAKCRFTACTRKPPGLLRTE